jgi:hemin uptake protein HemP
VSGDEGDAPAAPRATPPRHRAEELTAGGRLALIEHRGQLYSLRITRAGKLILTK